VIASWVWNVVIGGAAGMLCAIGGAFKDSPHEGFNPDTFMRSPTIGLLIGVATIPFTHNLFVVFCVAGYFERVAVEGWKMIRRQKPGKHSWRYSEWPALWSGQRPLDSKPPESPPEGSG
jgi:hypothetical protein